MFLTHKIETDGRQAGANQQMFLTYTIETADGHTIDGRRPFVTPGRFFYLLFKTPSYHYCRNPNIRKNRSPNVSCEVSRQIGLIIRSKPYSSGSSVIKVFALRVGPPRFKSHPAQLSYIYFF